MFWADRLGVAKQIQNKTDKEAIDIIRKANFAQAKATNVTHEYTLGSIANRIETLRRNKVLNEEQDILDKLIDSRNTLSDTLGKDQKEKVEETENINLAIIATKNTIR